MTHKHCSVSCCRVEAIMDWRKSSGLARMDEYGNDFGDKNWKWGIFYVNRDDPKVWVPKRYGIGYTLNFGNRWSWAAVALIVVAIAVPLSIPVVMLRAIKHAHAGG